MVPGRWMCDFFFVCCCFLFCIVSRIIYLGQVNAGLTRREFAARLRSFIRLSLLD